MDIQVIVPVRTKDTWGEGRFGAPRGSRMHRGVDYCAAVDSVLISPVTGYVTKLGYPYGDDLSYRYVQVTTPDGRRHRFFYVEPDVTLGEEVLQGDTELGTVQDIVRRYPVPRGMKNHFHYEIIDGDVYIDPEGDD